MYREYRNTNINSAIETLCNIYKFYLIGISSHKICLIISFPLFIYSIDDDMAGKHRARNKSIQIIRTAEVEPKDCKRDYTIAYHVIHFFQNLLVSTIFQCF